MIRYEFVGPHLPSLEWSEGSRVCGLGMNLLRTISANAGISEDPIAGCRILAVKDQNGSRTIAVRYGRMLHDVGFRDDDKSEYLSTP